MTRRYVTTKEQRTALTQLRARLGEMGFGIERVQRMRGAHARAFVAVKRDTPNHLLLIRPHRDGWVSITPYLSPCLYERERGNLEALLARLPAPVFWDQNQLIALPDEDSGWLRYVPKTRQRSYLEAGASLYA